MSSPNYVAVAADFASPILAINEKLSASFTCVDELLVDPDVLLAADVVDQISIHSPDNGHSNNSVLCIQRPLGNTSILSVTGRAIQSADSSTEIDAKATVSSAVADKHMEDSLLVNSSHDTSQGSSHIQSHVEQTVITPPQPAQSTSTLSNPLIVQSHVEQPVIAPSQPAQSTSTLANLLTVQSHVEQTVITPSQPVQSTSTLANHLTVESRVEQPVITSPQPVQSTSTLANPLTVQSHVEQTVITPPQPAQSTSTLSNPLIVQSHVEQPVIAPSQPAQSTSTLANLLTVQSHVEQTVITPSQPVQSTSTLANPLTVESHVEQPVIMPSSSSSTTQTSTTESTAETSVTGSPFPLSPQSTVCVDSPSLAQPFTCLPSGSFPTPKADFLTSPSRSFDVFYAAQASEEGGVQLSSSNFTRHGRRSEVFRRRHQERNYERTRVPGRNRAYSHSREIYGERGAYRGRISQSLRRRHTTGRTQREIKGYEEPRYARTAVLVQNRVYDIDEVEGAYDDGLGDASPSVHPSAAASEGSSSHVGLGIGVETGGQ
ncbi:hypothetical protein C0993_011157 [Termitomyces sp. T159_Od127]|nr:hypothetical protein C0993_011157 [Termitomyces sp. T159_Od127]